MWFPYRGEELLLRQATLPSLAEDFRTLHILRAKGLLGTTLYMQLSRYDNNALRNGGLFLNRGPPKRQFRHKASSLLVIILYYDGNSNTKN